MVAESMQVTITEHDGGVKGWYDPATRTVSLRRGLLDVERRCTLAHELAHVFYGDRMTGVEHLDAATERRADRLAAQVLIDEAAYRQAEQQCGGHAGAIALELGVTVHMLQVWQHTVQVKIKA